MKRFAMAAVLAAVHMLAWGGELRPRGEVAFIRRDWMDILIPVAGSTPGAFGTFFRSDVWISNYRATNQLIQVTWLPRGTDNQNAPKRQLTIPGNSFLFYEDFVATALQTSGLGAIWLRAIKADGSQDSDAKLDVVSRVWTNQPNCAGTVSQALLSLRAIDLFSYEDGYFLGLRQDPNFRTNVGVVSWDRQPRRFTVDVFGTTASTQFSFTVQPFGFEQVALPAGNWGALELRIRPEQPDTGGSYFWTGYATSVDNLSGDGWVIPVLALD